MAGGSFSPRKAGMILDLTHIIFGAAVVIMSVFAIFHPEENKVLFPFIFLFASVINFVTAWFLFRVFSRDKKKQADAFLYLFTGILIFAFFVISAISIWFRH